MTIFLPSEIRENIAIINQVPWGFGRFSLTPWDCSSIKDKRIKIEELSRMYTNIIKPGQHAALYMVRKKKNWRPRLENLKKNAPEETQDTLQKTIDAWVDYFERFGIHEEYEFIIAIELNTKQNWIHALSNITGVPYEKINPLAGEMLTDERLESLKEEFQRRTAPFRIKPLSTLDIVEFYRDFNYQGMKKPPVREETVKVWPWSSPDMTWLMPNPYEDGDRYIRIDGEDGIRYVAFIAVAILPSKIYAPGFDLFFDIQSLGIPVDAQFRFTILDSKLARMFAGRKRKAARANNQHSSEAGADSADDYETEINAERMYSEAKRSKGIMNEGVIVFSVTAYDPEELEHHVETFMDFLKDKDIVAHRVIADQMELYESWLPAQRWSAVGYKQRMFPNRSAAITLPGVSEIVGDSTGLPKGLMEVNRKPFRYFLPYGVLNNRPSVLVLVGVIGSGKSHLAYDVIRDTLISIPSRGIAFDPKNEKKDIAKHFPGYTDVQEITIDGNQYPGVFDPFAILKYDMERAKEKAIAMIQRATNFYDVTSENLIMRAVDEVGFKYESNPHEYEPSMIRVVEELKQMDNEKANDIAFKLERISRLSHGKLIFGDRNAPGAKKLDLPRTGFIVIRIAGLNLPDKGQQAVDLDQRVSQSVNIGKNILSREFLMQGKEKGVFSFLFSDECYHDFEMEETRKDYEFMTRQGRSSFCGMIFATQNPSDIPQAILNNTGTYICLGTETMEETKLAMKELRIDPNNEAIAEDLMNLGAEQSSDNQTSEEMVLKDREYSLGYVRDMYGRTGLVRFYTPEKDVRQFLRNTPTLEQKSDSHDPSSSSENTYIEVV